MELNTPTAGDETIAAPANAGAAAPAKGTGSRAGAAGAALPLRSILGVNPGRAPGKLPGSPDPIAFRPLIEGYDITGYLGGGGMGTVWRAIQLSTGREVALKIIGAAGISSERARARFRREVELTAQLTHPNIAGVYDGGLNSGVCFYAMELVDGVPLDQFVKGHGPPPRPEPAGPNGAAAPATGEPRPPSPPADVGGTAATKNAPPSKASAAGKSRRADATNPGRAMPRRRVLELMKTICEAMRHAHQKGIIHRDLKPGNILVDRDGRPRVVDFGLAKALVSPANPLGDDPSHAGGPALSFDGEVAGTPAYMSPEQAAGRTAEIDTRSDVYSLGAISFHLLTGSFPHDVTGSDVEVMRRIADTEPRRLREVDPSADRELEALLGKALAHEPGLRYDSAGELAEDLDRYLTGRPLVARLPTLRYLLAKRVRKHRALLVAAAAVALLLLGMAVGAYVKIVRARNVALAAAEAEKRAKVEAQAGRAAAESSARAEAAERAGGLIAQGDALGLSERWQEAFDRYEEARAVLSRLGLNTDAAELAAWDAYRRTSPALLTIAGAPAATGATLTSGATGAPAAGAPAAPAPGCAVFCPDGVRFACAAADALQVRDARLGRVIHSLRGHTGAVNAVAVAAGGRLALTGGRDATVRLWDVDAGRLLLTLRDDSPVRCVSLSADGKVALSGNDNKEAKIWDLSAAGGAGSAGSATATSAAAEGTPADGAARATDPRRRWTFADAVSLNAVCLSGDGKRALVALTSESKTGAMRLYDVDTGAVAHTFTHVTAVTACAFSADGALVAAGERDTQVRVWDAATGRALAELSGHRGGVRGVAFSPDGRLLASASDDGTVRLWDSHAFAQVAALTGAGGPVTSASFSPDGRFVLAGGAGGAARVWATSNVPALRGMYESLGAVNAVALSDDGRLAFGAGGDGRLRLWDLPTGRQLGCADARVALTAVALVPGGRFAVTGSAPGARDTPAAGTNFQVWDLTDPAAIRFVRGFTVVRAAANPATPGGEPPSAGSPGTGMAVAVAPDGRTALVGGDHDLLALVDLQTGEKLREFPSAAGHIRSVAFAPDGSLAAAGGAGAAAWDVRDPRAQTPARALGVGGGDRGIRLAFGPGGAWLFGGGRGGDLFEWDAATGGALRVFDGQAGFTKAVAVAPGGRVGASGHVTGVVKLWDLATGTLLRPLPVHHGSVLSLAWARDAGVAVSGGEDRTARCYDFDHLRQFRALRPRAEAAARALGDNPDDPAALAALGEWYAFCGAWDWAVACLEAARARGAAVSPLTLGRSYWQSGDPGLAAEEFAEALKQAPNQASSRVAPGPAPAGGSAAGTGSPTSTSAPASQPAGGEADYLRLCLEAARREAGASLGRMPLARSLAGHGAPVVCVAASGDGKLALTGAADGVVKLWNLSTALAVRTFAAHQGAVYAVAFLPDARDPAAAPRSAVTAGADGAVRVWRLDDARESRSFAAHDGAARGLAVDPRGRFVVSCGEDRAVNLWDLTGDPAGAGVARPRPFGTRRGLVAAAVALSPDGSVLAASTDGQDRHIFLWDVAGGELLHTLSDHADYARALAFSPDGRTLLSASKDQTLKTWDVASGEPLQTFAGHAAGVWSAAFARDGRTILSGGEDGSVKLWDAATGRELLSSGRGAPVRGVALLADGRTALSVGEDRTVKAWDVTPRAAGAGD